MFQVPQESFKKLETASSQQVDANKWTCIEASQATHHAALHSHCLGVLRIVHVFEFLHWQPQLTFASVWEK